MKNIATQHKQVQTSVMPFNFGEHEIRVQDENGEHWFVTYDVVKALGYEKPRNVIARRCKHQSTAPKQGGVFFFNTDSWVRCLPSNILLQPRKRG